jgi:hypothetical protein
VFTGSLVSGSDSDPGLLPQSLWAAIAKPQAGDFETRHICLSQAGRVEVHSQADRRVGFW